MGGDSGAVCHLLCAENPRWILSHDRPGVGPGVGACCSLVSNRHREPCGAIPLHFVGARELSAEIEL